MVIILVTHDANMLAAVSGNPTNPRFLTTSSSCQVTVLPGGLMPGVTFSSLLSALM
jgi:hypothetical protein